MATNVEGGRPSNYLAANLAAIRRRRGVTVRRLSSQLADLGVTLLPSGITKIEQGARRVDVDELVALAVALNVSPTRLVLPDTAEPDDDVRLTPELTAGALDAWRWFEGDDALPRPGAPEVEHAGRSHRRIEPNDSYAYRQERPDLLRRREEHPLVRAVARLAHAAQWAYAGDAESTAWAREELARVDAELAALERSGGERG